MPLVYDPGTGGKPTRWAELLKSQKPKKSKKKPAPKPKMVSAREELLLEAGLDPDGVFALAKWWLFEDGLSVDDVSSRIKQMANTGRDALKKGVAPEDLLSHAGPDGESIQDKLDEWRAVSDSWAPRPEAGKEFDWRTVVDAATTKTAKQAYWVHAAVDVGTGQGTPSVSNRRGMTLLKRKKGLAGEAFVSTSSRAALQEVDAVKEAVKPVAKLAVEGVGKAVANPDAEIVRANLLAARQRIERLRRELEEEGKFPTARYPTLLSQVRSMPPISDEFTASGLAKWPLAFLRERERAWKDAFARRIASWYLRTRDEADAHLAEAGWSRNALGTRENPTLMGNDVRINALALIEKEVLKPAAEEASVALEGAKFKEIPVTSEEAREMAFALFDSFVSSARGWKTDADEVAEAIKGAFAAHPPPSIWDDYGAWRKVRDFREEKKKKKKDEAQAWWKARIDAIEEWLRNSTRRWTPGEGKKPRPPQRSAISRRALLGSFERYVSALAVEGFRRRAKEATETALPEFLAFHADERALASGIDVDPDALSASDNVRYVAYMKPGKDPTYRLLLRLAAYPEEGRVEKIWNVSGAVLDELQKRWYEGRVIPDEVGPLSEAIVAVKPVLAKFYALPLDEAASFFPLADASKGKAGGALEEFPVWIRYLRASLDDALPPRPLQADALYEIARLKKALDETSKWTEVPSRSDIRRGPPDERILLKAVVRSWPPPARKISFEWFDEELGAVVGKKEEHSVGALASRALAAPVSSVLEVGSKGAYVCAVEARDDAGTLVAEGRSVARTVTLVAKCARCCGDYDVDSAEATAFPDGTRAGAAEKHSTACEWTTALLPTSAEDRGALVEFRTFEAALKHLWDATKVGDDAHPPGEFLHSHVRRAVLLRKTADSAKTPPSLGELLAARSHFDVLEGASSAAGALARSNAPDGPEERAQHAAALKTLTTLKERFGAFEMEHALHVEKIPGALTVGRNGRVARPEDEDRSGVADFTGARLRSLLGKERPPDFDVSALFDVAVQPMAHSESAASDATWGSPYPKKAAGRLAYVGAHSESAVPDRHRIAIDGREQTKGPFELVSDGTNRLAKATLFAASFGKAKSGHQALVATAMERVFEELAEEEDAAKMKELASELEELMDAY